MATKDQKNNLSRVETKMKARDMTESASNANDAQRKNMASSLIRRGRRKGMSDNDIVRWLTPIFQPWEKKDTPTDTPETQPKVIQREEVATDATERVTTWSLTEWTPTTWPVDWPVRQWIAASDAELPGAQQIDVLSTAVSSSISTMPPSVLALSLQQGKITQQDFDTLSAVNPELYSQAVLFKQQLDLQNSINAKWAELIQASENLASTYAERARNIWGELAVEEYNSLVGGNRFARQMKEKAETIAQIDDSLDFIQEDTEDEVGSWNLWYILAKADKWRRELHRERSLLVSEYNALKTQADYEYNQWLEKYKVYRAAEDQKMQISMEYAQAKYWIAQEQYQMSVAETNNKLKQLTSISEDVTDFYDQKRAEQLSIQEQEEAMVAMEQMQLTNQAILSLYNGISIEDRAVLSTLPTESVQSFLKQYNEVSKIEKPIIHKTGDSSYVAIDPNTWMPLYEHTQPTPWSLDESVTNSIIEGERWGECGTWARTVAGMKGLPGGDNLQERINQFSEKTPQVWGMILFNGTWYTNINNNQPIRYDTQYGHIALIESVNPDGTLNISESNLKDDEKISRRTISPSDPAISGYYNKTPLAEKMAVEQKWFDENLSSLYIHYLEKGTLTWPILDEVRSLWMDIKELGKQANQYKIQVGDKRGEEIARNMIDELAKLRKMSEEGNRLQRMSSSSVWQVSPKWAAYNSQFNFVKQNLTLDKFLELKEGWATFWAMSDWEWVIVWNAATALSRTLELGDLQSVLDDHISALQKAIPWGYNPHINIPKEWEEPQSDAVEEWRRQNSSESLIPK